MTRAPLVTVRHPEHREFRVLLRDFDVQGYRIPRGFIWEGCSVPAFVWPLIGHPWDNEFRNAALLHDELYTSHRTSRARADELFHRQLLADGVGRIRAHLMWQAVRRFGRSAYDTPSQWPRYMPAEQLAELETAAPVELLPLISNCAP